jgi:hypothetical protein
MSDERNSPVEVLMALAIALAAIPLFGYVTSVMWRWFVAPLGVPQIGVAHAMGISTLVAMFKPKEPKDEDTGLWIVVGKGVLTPLIMLLIGSVFHWAMTP